MASHLSRIAKEMIANSHLSPPIQNSYDLSGIKILCNEAHLTLLEAVFIPAHVFWKEVKVNLELEFFQCTNDGLIGDSQAFSDGRHRDFLD